MKGGLFLISCTWILHRRAHSCKASCTFHCALLDLRCMHWHCCIRAQQTWRILEYLRYVKALLREQILKAGNIGFWEIGMSWNQRHSDNSVPTTDVEIFKGSQIFLKAPTAVPRDFTVQKKKKEKKKEYRSIRVSSPAPECLSITRSTGACSISWGATVMSLRDVPLCHPANGSSWERGRKKVSLELHMHM